MSSEADDICYVGSVSQAPVASSHENSITLESDVPAPPTNTAVGGNASVQPKRTPVSEREIEAILVSKNFVLSVILDSHSWVWFFLEADKTSKY